MTTTKTRLDLLKRKIRGRKIKLDLERLLLESAGLPVAHFQLLSLEESDAIRVINDTNFASRIETHAISDAVIPFLLELRLPLAQLSSGGPPIPLSDADFYVIFPDSDVAGVLSVSGEIFHTCWERLVDISPDGFVVLDKEMHNRLVIQVVEDEGAEPALDIGAWGEAWRDAVLRWGREDLLVVVKRSE